ncbi:Alpha/Beta hydrolase protein [Hypoxylon sp. NC1633]|nr:Alpha/Beta hydrolase protein [Hypoxylon sp. NC1633]
MSTTEKKAEPAGGQLELLWAILPHIPLILKVVVLHALRLSESAKYLDMRSNLIISVLRSMLDPRRPSSVSKVQAVTLRDPGVKGKLWVSTVASKVPPEQNIRDALFAAIDGLHNPGQENATLRVPDIVPVEAEWTGFRAAATKESTLPAIPEEEKYREMMKECTSPATLLFLHGGAYYLCDPAMYRPLVNKLAQLSGGRVYSVRYRLAPQSPFPAALLDALVSYFTLLYPPPGSVHEAVAPEHIVFGGDSAGGNLALALLQTLLGIRRQNRKITWFGEEREVPLPAGVTCCSPWVDVVQSMTSYEKNQKWCYLPVPRLMDEDFQRTVPEDHLWPTKPPRKHIYVDDAYLLHHLVTLQIANTWEGSPPVYINCGWESLEDESKYMASKLARDGVTVVFEEYEAMPHVFVGILPERPESKRAVSSWANFIKEVCEDPKKIQPSYKTIKAKATKEVDIDIDNLSSFTEEEVKRLAHEKVSGQKAPLPDVPAKL